MTAPDSARASASVADESRVLALADGEFTIPADYGDAVRDATGAVRGDGPPPTILATVATLAASGASIDSLLAQAGASVADGPMLGECTITAHARLQYGCCYRVTRRFVSLSRKRSTRLGAMDVLVFVATLVAPGGTVTADVRYTWILPKGNPT